MKKKLYHILDRETIQNVHTDIIGAALNFKDTLQNDLRDLDPDIQVLDWVNTCLETHKDDDPATLWVFTIYNPNGTHIDREYFDPDNACDISRMEAWPYHEIVTITCS